MDHRLPWRLQRAWKSRRRGPLRISPCHIYCCVLITVGAVKSKVPCGSHSHCNLLLGNHTQYEVHTNILQAGSVHVNFFIKLSPNFLQHQPLGTANFRSCQICFGNYQHNAAQEDNAVSSSWLQAKLQIALKWFQCHNCMPALLPITHTEIPKAPVTNTHTKKLCPLCYFKQVQLTSEDLLMCWARHMLKYFPELTPDTTSPALSPLLSSHALPHSVTSWGAQSWLW